MSVQKAIESTLRGCADVLDEADKAFRANNPRCKTPTLYAMHADRARDILGKMEKEGSDG